MVNSADFKIKGRPKIWNCLYDCAPFIFMIVCLFTIDISKNRFTEIPKEVCEFTLLEKLDCYNNSIRSLPESITQLQYLKYLNLRSVILSHITLLSTHHQTRPQISQSSFEFLSNSKICLNVSIWYVLIQVFIQAINVIDSWKKIVFEPNDVSCPNIGATYT